MKQVRETKSGKEIAAWIILNKKNQHVATVQAYYGNRVQVDVWHMTGDTKLQQGSASGYGYDKFTAALSGLIIDGHKMTDHCGARIDNKEGVWPYEAKPKKGYHFANYSQEKGGYTSCYRLSGLDYLKAFDYKVIQAI